MPADTGATLYAYENAGLGPYGAAYTEVAVPTPETSGNTAWQYNGKAVISGGHVSLVDPADGASATGSVICKTVVPVDALDITFTLYQGGGGGADGVALAFFDSAVESAASLGGSGGGLGILGRQVAALSFDEYNAQFRWDTSTTGATALTHVQSATATDLHNDTSVWRLTMVKLSAGSYQATIWRNGAQYQQWVVPCADTAYVGFTAADGAILDAHQISAVSMNIATALPGDARQAAETHTYENAGLGFTKQSARVLQTAVSASEGNSATFTNPVLPGRYVVVGIRDYFNYANECHYTGDSGAHVLPQLVGAGIVGVSLYGGYITDTNVTAFAAFATGSGGEIAEVIALEIAGLDGTAPTAVGPTAGGVTAQPGQLVIGFDVNNPSTVPVGWTLLGQRYDANHGVGVTAAMISPPVAGAYGFGSTVLFSSRELDVTVGASLETYENAGLAVVKSVQPLAFVQNVSGDGNNFGNNATINITLDKTPHGGDTIIAVVSYYPMFGPPISVSGLGAIWRLLRYDETSVHGRAVYEVRQCDGISKAMSLVFPQGMGAVSFDGQEFSGGFARRCGTAKHDYQATSPAPHPFVLTTPDQSVDAAGDFIVGGWEVWDGNNGVSSVTHTDTPSAWAVTGVAHDGGTVESWQQGYLPNLAADGSFAHMSVSLDGPTVEDWWSFAVTLAPWDPLREATLETYIDAVFERIASSDAVIETYVNSFRPPNDTIATAWVVPSTTTVGTDDPIDLSQYHNEAGDPVTGSAWWKWQPGSGPCFATTFGSSFDTAMEVYSGPANATSISQLTPIQFNDDYIGLQSRVDFTGDNFTWFYIVAGQLGAGGVPAGTLKFNWNGPAYTPPTPVMASATMQRQRSLAVSAHQELNVVPVSATMQRQRSLRGPAAALTTAPASATLQRSRSMATSAAAFSPPPNDDIASAIELVGLSGSLGYTTVAATIESLEPDFPAFVLGPAGTVWFWWQPNASVHAVMKTAPSMSGVGPKIGFDVYVYDSTNGFMLDGGLLPLGTAPVSLATIDDPTVEWDTRPDEVYYIRAYPLEAGQDPDAPVLTWTTTPLPIDVTIPSPLVTNTPTTLQVNVTNELVGVAVTFTVDNNPTVRASATVDENGNAIVQVPIPDLFDGAHMITVRDALSRAGNAVFTVSQDVTYYPPPPPPPPPPPYVVPPAAPVTKWRFQDATTGEVWDFPINPTTCDPANLPRTLTPATTTALQGGQPIIFEGAVRARPWAFEGRVLTLDDRDALERWRRPYRVYLADDFGRVFIVKVLSVQMTPQLDTNHPEQHTYTVNCVFYGRLT